MRFSHFWSAVEILGLESVSVLIQTHWNQHEYLQHKHTQLHKFSPWRLTSTWRQEVNVTQQPPPLVLPLSGGETLCNTHPLSLQVISLTSLFSSYRVSSTLTHSCTLTPVRVPSGPPWALCLCPAKQSACAEALETLMEMQESSESEKRQRGGGGGDGKTTTDISGNFTGMANPMWSAEDFNI